MYDKDRAKLPEPRAANMQKAVQEVFEIVYPLTPIERGRVLGAVRILCGKHENTESE